MADYKEDNRHPQIVSEETPVNVNFPEFTDYNLNPEIKEMPIAKPNLAEESEISVPDHLSVSGRDDQSIPDDLTITQELLDERRISDAVGLQQPAGIPSTRNYKMASDIFGTGMDKAWDSDKPGKSDEQPYPISPLTPPLSRNRNEPASFKITEVPSAKKGGLGSASDTGNSSTSRKARESAGNPLTGQGYKDEGAKTAKRYYEGINSTQKLW